MNDESKPRRIIHVTPRGRRKPGRPGTRWKEGVGKDARTLINETFVVYSYE